jgi:PAS domain S-box-containing protein
MPQVDREHFNDLIENMAGRVQLLQHRVRQASPDTRAHLVEQATVELQTALEELRAAEDEVMTARADAESQHERYRELFEFAPDAYLVTTARGVITEANWAAAQLLNIQETILAGKPMMPYVHPDDRGAYWAAIRLLQSDARGQWTLRITPRHQEPIMVEATVGAVRSHNGSLAGMRWMLRDVSAQKKAETQLEDNRRQLQEMTSELQLAEERERRRLATLIHDEVGQALAVAQLRLGALRSSAPGSSGEVDEVRALVGQALGYCRSLSFELSSPVLYELGLGPALQWLVEQRSTQALRFTFQDDGTLKPLPQEIEVLLFQSARELIVNAMKHSKGANGRVRLLRRKREVLLEVEDDGIGMNAQQLEGGAKKMNGIGLFSIRERLHHLGGRVELLARPGGGARIRLYVPLSMAHPASEGKGHDKSAIGG